MCKTCTEDNSLLITPQRSRALRFLLSESRFFDIVRIFFRGQFNQINSKPFCLGFQTGKTTHLRARI